MDRARQSASDDFVDGLRLRPEPPRRKRSIPLGGPRVGAPPLKGRRGGLTRPAVCATVGFVALISFCAGFISAPRDHAVTGPTVYVTVPASTQPAEAQPTEASTAPACLEAITSAERLLSQGSRLASSTDKVLDIIGRANQAVLSYDTKKLNAAVDELRALANDLEHDKVVVMIPYQSIMDGFKACPVH